MRYDLIAMVARSPRAKRQRVFAIPVTLPPRYLEHDLLVILMKVVKTWDRLMREKVLPLYDVPVRDGRVQDDQSGLEAALDAVDGEVRRLLLILYPELNDWVLKAESIQRRDFVASVLTATGIDLATVVGLAPAQETMAATVARLVNLVTGLNDDTKKRLGDVIWQGFTARTPRSAVAKQIRHVMEVSRSRALLIASDQTTKLAGILDEERQREAGLDRYRWRHSRKAHPRKEHVARDGKLFFWSKPPHDGHPGYAIRCGCKAQAYFDLDAL